MYMKICTYYVIHMHEDIHVLCNIVTRRYAHIMYHENMKISGGCAKESLDEVEEQSDIEADGGINSAMSPKSQMSLRHTVSQITTLWNGPMADLYYEQQKALGHVVEGMQLRFQLRGQTRCLVNVFEALGRESVACFIGRFLRIEPK